LYEDEELNEGEKRERNKRKKGETWTLYHRCPEKYLTGGGGGGKRKEYLSNEEVVSNEQFPPGGL